MVEVMTVDRASGVCSPVVAVVDVVRVVVAELEAVSATQGGGAALAAQWIRGFPTRPFHTPKSRCYRELKVRRDVGFRTYFFKPPTKTTLGKERLLECNQMTQQLVELPESDENASVDTRSCKLRDTVQSTVLSVFGLDGDDAAVSNLLTEKQRLH
ncbi:hypothetical protein SprV_0301097400 [Sparganum proliferum]